MIVKGTKRCRNTVIVWITKDNIYKCEDTFIHGKLDGLQKTLHVSVRMLSFMANWMDYKTLLCEQIVGMEEDGICNLY